VLKLIELFNSLENLQLCCYY